MKALLKNFKTIKQEVIVCEVDTYDIATLRSMIEKLNGEINKGTKLELSSWSDSSDYVVTKITDNKIILKVNGRND